MSQLEAPRVSAEGLTPWPGEFDSIPKFPPTTDELLPEASLRQQIVQFTDQIVDGVRQKKIPQRAGELLLAASVAACSGALPVNSQRTDSTPNQATATQGVNSPGTSEATAGILPSPGPTTEPSPSSSGDDNGTGGPLGPDQLRIAGVGGGLRDIIVTAPPTQEPGVGGVSASVNVDLGTKPPEKPDPTKWYNQIPPNPYKTPGEVPIATDTFGHKLTGDLKMEVTPNYEPGFALKGSGFTLLSAKADIENNRIIIKATSNKGEIKKSNCTNYTVNGHNVDACTWTGGAETIILKAGAGITARNGNDILGTSLSDAAKFLKPGTSIRFTVGFGPTPLSDSLLDENGKKVFTKADFNSNLRNFEAFKSKENSNVSKLGNSATWIVEVLDVDTG